MLMSRHDLVEDVAALIPNSRVRAGLLEIVDILPGYFFVVPASPSGKHHPEYSLGKGGLLRHSKAAVKIGSELMGNTLIAGELDDVTKSLMLVAIFVHDGQKLGRDFSTHTYWEHPIMMQQFLMENESKIPSLKHDELVFIGDLIKTHMGEWTVDPATKKEVLEKPSSSKQLFVHLCDYLSSKKCINLKFTDNWMLCDEDEGN